MVNIPNEVETFSEKERLICAHIGDSSARTELAGKWNGYFSEERVGKALLNKILAGKLAHWSGFYLSGRDCYRLTDKGDRVFRRLAKAVLNERADA